MCSITRADAARTVIGVAAEVRNAGCSGKSDPESYGLFLRNNVSEAPSLS
jgi:hypothetical protein